MRRDLGPGTGPNRVPNSADLTPANPSRPRAPKPNRPRRSPSGTTHNPSIGGSNPTAHRESAGDRHILPTAVDDVQTVPDQAPGDQGRLVKSVGRDRRIGEIGP